MASDSHTHSFQEQIIHSFVQGFKKRDGLNKKQKAQAMLTSFFRRMGFNFTSFCEKLRLGAKDIDQWISYIYYAIYYYEFPLEKYWKESRQLPFFLLCLLAETVNEKKLCEILQCITPKKQLQLICYCSLNMREGAWFILQGFELLFENNHEWSVFLLRVRNNYYDLSSYQEFIDHLPDSIPSDLSMLLSHLEQKAISTVDQITHHLPILINEIIESPIEGFNVMEKQKRMLGMASMGSDLTDKVKKNAEGASERLRQLFAPYLEQTYSSEEMQEFFQLFGLKGYFFNSPAVKNPQESLLEMLHDISQFVRMPNALTGDYIQSTVSFVLSFCRQLYAFHRDPQSYKEGLGHIVYTLATRGSGFTKLEWLPSVLNGFETLRRHLVKNGSPSFSLTEYPIIIFDQATTQEWKKNHAFILKLEKKFQACIWHLSNEQTLAFAKKLGVEHWIKVSAENNFGYAGSRNCTLLLAPVIYKASQQGKNNINALLKMSDIELTSLFDQFVLGKKGEDLLIHTGEDDAALPACNFFSDTLFAHKHFSDYLQRPIYCTGRQTYDLKYHLDLKTLLKFPSLAFKSTRWSDMPIPGAMKGLLTKPKFCLPFPFGNEECHVMAPKTYYDPFHQPLLHLSGTRFPKKLYPTSPYDGLVEFLEKHLPYVLQTIMTEDLIDQIRIDEHHGILPWNNKELKKARPFKSLDDLWDFANSAETLKEIKQRFWVNFDLAFQKSPPKGYIFKSGLCPLTKLPSRPAVPASLLKFYQAIQQDARLLLDFATEVAKAHKLSLNSNREFQDADLQIIQKKVEKRHKIKFSQTKLTKGLQLILQWINSLKKASMRHT